MAQYHLLLPVNYFLYLGLHVAWSEAADLDEDRLAVPIHQDQCWYSSHTKADCSLTSHPAHHVEPNHSRLAIQLSLQPIYDGFRQQARTSKV
jgi:hypothetical protein